MPMDSDPKEHKLIEAFQKIKDELNDHLTAINDNTNEIQANYEYLEQLDSKLGKLNEKMDEIRMALKLTQPECSDPAFERIMREVRLTPREQEVFLLLYTASDFLPYPEISRKLGLPQPLVADYITNLIEKGIPVIKRYVGKEPHIRLDPCFKEQQAKKNLVAISPRLLPKN